VCKGRKESNESRKKEEREEEKGKQEMYWCIAYKHGPLLIEK
jgi:hypothetical protein